MSEVFFHHADAAYRLEGITILKQLLADLFRKEGRRLASLSVVFCSDDHLLSMNRQFLQHDYYTDIITFGLSEKNQPIEAEIYISIDRVKDNALSLGVAYKEEMLRVIFHGALHLCGYKDKTKSEISAMRAKEDQYLQLFAKTQK